MSLQRKAPLKRTGIKRGESNLKRSGRLAPKSAKRRAEDAPDGPRHAVRQLTIWRANNRCQAIGLIPDHRCGFYPSRPGLEVHERIPRSLYPGGHLDPDNTLALCPVAHDWVDEHQEHARELGLHGRATDRPGAR